MPAPVFQDLKITFTVLEIQRQVNGNLFGFTNIVMPDAETTSGDKINDTGRKISTISYS